MNRLTERLDNGQASVKACGECCKHDNLCVELDNSIFDCPEIDDIIDKLADYEDMEEQATSKWIPCSERLPKLRRKVLVTAKEGNHTFVTMAFFTEHSWMHRDPAELSDETELIAWMPLPEPYESEVE